MTYADIVIDTKSDNVDNLFTYEADGVDGLRAGSRVTVPFAQERAKRGGYVFALHEELPEGLEGKRMRRIESVQDDESIPESAIGVCEWMKRRYYCRYIDAARCFSPPGKAPKRKKAGAAASPAEGGGASAELAGNGGSAKPELVEIISTIYPPTETAGRDPDCVENTSIGNTSPAAPPLTREQERAAERICPHIGAAAPGQRPKVFLLRGVTGSGKTEVYMAAVQKAVSLGRSAIMLVPEISLTHQTVARFIERFGEGRIAVLHSGLTPAGRRAEWGRIARGEVDIVIGARSAVFAPARGIGAIIVDEEHEGTYKSDMSPKYDAVEVAVKRGQAEGAVVILGSATPSVVSSCRAEQGYYELVCLTKRYNTTPLPQLTVIDMRKELLRGNKSVFSEALYAAMLDAFAAGKQAMLFLNRRGWSSYVSCPHCGYVLKCSECNITMSYHKATDSADCHFCGATTPAPTACPSCGVEGLRYFGIGTEQVEALAKEAFPGRRVARMDVDSTKERGSAAKILADFAAKKTDILIGTQMIAKGLDFADVAVVGVVSADITLNIPDFKSPERAFQLVTQVAGRAGRRDERGSVYVQTCMPGNYAIEAAKCHDYEGFYRSELFFRKTLSYPPFTDVIQITVFAPDEAACGEGARRVHADVCTALGEAARGRVLGPTPAPVARIDGDYRYHVYIKADTARRRQCEAALSELKRRINTDPAAGCRVVIDVNPYSFM